MDSCTDAFLLQKLTKLIPFWNLHYIDVIHMLSPGTHYRNSLNHIAQLLIVQVSQLSPGLVSLLKVRQLYL